MKRNQVVLSTLDNITLYRKLRKFNKLIGTDFKHLDIIYGWRSDDYNWFIFRFYQIMSNDVYLVFSEPVNCHINCYRYLRKNYPKKYFSSLGHLLANCSLSEQDMDQDMADILIEQYMENRRAEFIDKWKELKKD